jgi:hypothetical protein
MYDIHVYKDGKTVATFVEIMIVSTDLVAGILVCHIGFSIILCMDTVALRYYILHTVIWMHIQIPPIC